MTITKEPPVADTPQASSPDATPPAAGERADRPTKLVALVLGFAAVIATAQALMARHSIDAAMLAQTGPEGGTSAEAPLARRIWIDNPYEAPKVMLLDVVATANRCRAVWSNHLGFVTVLGHAGDLAATETIFTSLLVQATAAMRGHGSRTTRDGRSRTTAFRRTFLGSYAQRIGERLQEVTDAETAEAVSRADAAARAADDRVDAPVGAAAPTSGRQLVRVLTVRADAVDHRVEELFPDMTFRTVARPSDHEGWSAGRRAADQASLFAPERVVGG